MPGRGGSTPRFSLPQPHTNECWLVISLSSWQEIRGPIHQLKAEGLSTRYCKVWEGARVSAAWVLHSATLVASLSSIVIHFQTFHTRNLCPFWAFARPRALPFSGDALGFPSLSCHQ
ncbi:hypothetical protein BJV78DRAFT_277169 [Lactifluus subvellereus]|nr:hypothetical protein BJV78DRAFT_277169 [Lactifluus subvellereus]